MAAFTATKEVERKVKPMSFALMHEEDDEKILADRAAAAAAKIADKSIATTEEVAAEDSEEEPLHYGTSSGVKTAVVKTAPKPPTPPPTRSGFALKKKLSITDCPSEVFCVKHSPDGKLLAAGCGDGAIRVYSVATGKLTYNLNVESMTQLPTTAIRFRPATGRSKTKNVLLAVNADGSVDHWHITSGRRLHTITEEDNQLFCVDYRSDGSAFAAAGKDYKIRIYDEATKTRTSVLSAGFGSRSSGHSNRIFSLKFKPTDSNIVVSGGWDKTVQVWDLRVESAVRSFFGPHIAGDAIDICGDEILTGSWRPDEALQTWDLGTGKPIETIRWDPFQSARSGSPCQLYAAQYSKFGPKAGRFIAAGGSGSNEARVFDHSNANALVGVVTGLTRAVFTADFSPTSRSVAFAGGNSAIHIFNVVSRTGDVASMSEDDYRESLDVSIR